MPTRLLLAVPSLLVLACSKAPPPDPGSGHAMPPLALDAAFVAQEVTRSQDLTKKQELPITAPPVAPRAAEPAVPGGRHVSATDASMMELALADATGCNARISSVNDPEARAFSDEIEQVFARAHASDGEPTVYTGMSVRVVGVALHFPPGTSEECHHAVLGAIKALGVTPTQLHGLKTQVPEIVVGYRE